MRCLMCGIAVQWQVQGSVVAAVCMGSREREVVENDRLAIPPQLPGLD